MPGDSAVVPVVEEIGLAVGVEVGANWALVGLVFNDSRLQLIGRESNGRGEQSSAIRATKQ